ncbi:MAG: hypothetical protein M1828_005473 [Chrysothrix sp. TS-e1954]|nr:MAG: hypothetical protein M1828_005473 [Chrysothrix sp. TS-e1954]
MAPFGVFNTLGDHQNAAAIIEWIIAFVFTLYIMTFIVDLLPALRTKHHYSQESVAEMAHGESSSYGNGSAHDRQYSNQNESSNF